MIKSIVTVFMPIKIWKWETKGAGVAVVNFKVKENEYTWRAVATDSNNPVDWSFQFHLKDHPDNEEIKLNNKGYSMEVMSTVIDITKTLIREETVLVLRFSGNGDSHKKLYTRLTKRLLPEWELKITKGIGGSEFCAINPKAKHESNRICI